MSSPALPDTVRINHKPIVLYGLNGTELATTAGVAGLIGMVLGLLTAALTGSLSLFPIFALLWTIVLSWGIGDWVRNEKRQKPEGYYAQQLCRVRNHPAHGLIRESMKFDYLRHAHGTRAASEKGSAR